MKRMSKASRLALASIGLGAQISFGFSVVQTTWVGPASGTWFVNPANWSGGVTPTSDFNFGYVPTIDGNTGQNTVVTVPSGSSFGLFGLNIRAGDELVIANNSSLSMLEFNNATTPLTITNAGIFRLAGTTAFTELSIQNPVTLNGGGTVIMGGPIGNRIYNANTGGTPNFTNVDNTIIGAGTIGVGGPPMLFTNNGTVTASAGTLTISSIAAIPYVNAGTYRAVAGGTLNLQSYTVFNNGSMNAIGGTIQAASMEILGGVLTSSAGGSMRLGGIGTASVNNILNMANNTGQLTLVSGNTADLFNVTNSGTFTIQPNTTASMQGSFTNNGTVFFDQLPSSATSQVIKIAGTVTFAGSGSVRNTNQSTSPIPLFERTFLTDTLVNHNNVVGRMRVMTNIENYGTFDSGGSGQGMLLGNVNNLQPVNIVNRPGGTIRASAFSQLVFAQNGTFTNFGNVICDASGSLVLNTNSYTSGAAFTNNGTVINIGSFALNGITGGGTLDFRGPAGVNSTIGQLRQGVALMQSGTLQILVDGTSAATARVNALNITSVAGVYQSTLDLTNNYMVWDYTGASPQATLQAYILSGYNNGSWNGSGLKSSTSANSSIRDGIGYAEAADRFALGPGGTANFAGQIVDNTSLVMRWTLLGDANLDGTVNITDFANLAANFNTAGPWLKGDFTYDGLINISDFSLLAASFNQSIPPVNPGPLPRSVPEPAGTIFALATLWRLRRKVR